MNADGVSFEAIVIMDKRQWTKVEWTKRPHLNSVEPS